MHECDDKVVLVTGPTVVSRNPVTHPGGVRPLMAVNRKKELGHLVNVVVFSSRGKRPAQEMMAGGDLDGDVYFVCWDRLLVKLVYPVIPVAYKGYKPEMEDAPVSEEIDDIIAFILKNDCLGIICTLHTALSDFHCHISPDASFTLNNAHKIFLKECSGLGPMDPSCVMLSFLASYAVDFAKHGQCISFDNWKDMNSEMQKHGWPDFLEKEDKKSYISKSVLGQLYRQVDENFNESFTRMDYEQSILLNYELEADKLPKKYLLTAKLF